MGYSIKFALIIGATRGTLGDEAQRRYFGSVSVLAQRHFSQMSVTKVDSIEKLPLALDPQ